MKTQMRFEIFRAEQFLLALVAAFLVLPGHAKMLDDFNGAAKTGWSDFIVGSGLGSVTQTGGQFVIDVPGVGQQLFAASARTSPIFEVIPNRTVTCQVDLVSGNDPDAVAVLAWLPTGKDISKLQGYSLAVSSDRIVVAKGLSRYFYDGDAPSKSENITLSLAVTADGTRVVIETKIIDRDTHAILFGRSFTDTAGIDVLATGTDSPPAP